MTTRTTPTTGSAAEGVVPTRIVRWTRLGAGLGYTNTEPKRQAIRAAAARMHWREPAQLQQVLDEPIVRYQVRGLFDGRAWALHRAAVSMLDNLPERAGSMRLIGLEAVTGERYLIVDRGYETVDLVHDRPVAEAVPSR